MSQSQTLQSRAYSGGWVRYMPIRHRVVGKSALGSAALASAAGNPQGDVGQKHALQVGVQLFYSAPCVR